MAVFSVIDSTLSPEALSPWLAAVYPYEAPPAVKLFRTGINHTYMVEGDGDKSVLRIYSHNWRSREQIEEEIKVLKLANEAGVSVSMPLCDREGSFIQGVEAPEGTRYAVLFSFAEGKKVRHFTGPLCEKLGRAIGRFHQATEGKSVERITYNAGTLAVKPYEYASRFFAAENAEMQYIKRSGEKLKEVFAAADHSHIRQGIVHLDIWYDNMNITPEEDFTLFDFDFCGNGWLLHDVAYFLMQMYHQEADKAIYERNKAAFLKGYQTVNELSAAEAELLPWSGLGIWIFYLGVQSRRFDNWSNVFLSENYLIRFMAMVKDWLAYNGVKECTS